MSKRYAEQIEVEAPRGSLEAFWWRGKRYRVRRVLGRWREAGGWWRAAEHASGAREPWAAGEAREILRVDALPRGVYEVARDLRSGAWTLSRVLD